MPVSRNAAKPLCTKDEFALAEESFAPAVNALSSKELRNRIQRARRLRDKYRGLAEKQAREILGRSKSTRSRTATNNRATVMKQRFFAETLARFEKRQEKVVAIEERKSLRAVAQKALEKRKAAQKRKQKARPKSGMTKDKGLQSAPNKKPEEFPNLPTMRGATRANHARSQARRDARR